MKGRVQERSLRRVEHACKTTMENGRELLIRATQRLSGSRAGHVGDQASVMAPVCVLVWVFLQQAQLSKYRGKILDQK